MSDYFKGLNSAYSFLCATDQGLRSELHPPPTRFDIIIDAEMYQDLKALDKSMILMLLVKYS